jgi:hypothetical protein
MAYPKDHPAEWFNEVECYLDKLQDRTPDALLDLLREDMLCDNPEKRIPPAACLAKLPQIEKALGITVDEDGHTTGLPMREASKSRACPAARDVCARSSFSEEYEGDQSQEDVPGLTPDNGSRSLDTSVED